MKLGGGSKPMRHEMPTVAGWIDALRAEFGAASIDASIRGGLKGLSTFHAEEAGHTLGTPVFGPRADLVEVGLSEPARWTTGRLE